MVLNSGERSTYTNQLITVVLLEALGSGLAGLQGFNDVHVILLVVMFVLVSLPIVLFIPYLMDNTNTDHD